MSVVAAALGFLLAVMCTLARDAFFGVVTGAVTSVLYANIAVGACRNRRGAFLAGVVVSFFPASLLLVRTLEFIAFLLRTEVSDRQRRGMTMDATIFSGNFIFFAALLLLHFIAWLRWRRPRGDARA